MKLSVLALALLTAAATTAAPPAARAQNGGTAAAATPPQSAAPPGAPSQERIQAVSEKLRPSLVRIRVVSGQPQGGRETRQESFGSGVIVSPDGYVVTNHHVAGNARWLSVTLSSREVVEAKLIGTDPLSDIAVIKLAASPSGAAYPVAAWGDSSRLRVGDAVLAMGSPLAFSQSVTAGIVSNTELIFPASMGEEMTLDGEDVGSIVRWIGHDAQIFPGNSGGPLISLDGEIIGINEIGVGLSGAIPGNLARQVAQQIIEKGRVTRAFVGLNLQPRLRSDNSRTGVLVGGVVAGSPAAQAGIRSGDLLVKAGDAPLDARFPEQIPLANLEVSRLPVGRATTVQLLREGKPLTLTLTPTERDAAQTQAVEVAGWGATFSDISPTMARERRVVTGTRGALVTTIGAGGPSAEAQPALEEGDVVLSLDGQPVADVTALKALTAKRTAKPGGSSVLVEVQREGERLLTVVEVGKEADDDTSVEVAKAWLPIDVQALTPALAKALKLPANLKGVRVTQVYPETAPDVAAKFRVGDIITRMDEMNVEADRPEDARAFFALVRQYKVGLDTKITLLRDGKPLRLTVPLVRGPRQERELPRYTDEPLGLTVRSVNYKDRASGDAAPGESGALVTEVTRGGWAALAGLRQGDIIRRIDGVPVTNMETASAKLKALDKQRPKTVVLFISRGVQTQFVEIQTDYSLTEPAATAARP